MSFVEVLGYFAGAGDGVTTACVAVSCDFGFSGQDPEHGCLVDSVGGVGAWVVAVFDDGVAPGPGPEDVPDVGDRVAEGVALFDCGEGVA